MAQLIRKETRQRGFFGWIFLLIFIGFNLLMLLSLFAGLANVGDLEAGSEAEKAGQAIGTVLGVGMILFIWVCGAIITGLLALFTRGRKIVVEETIA